MKKFLSLVLTLCMILGSVSLLASCGSVVSVNKIEENPAEVLADVIGNTDMFRDELGISDVIASSVNGGSVSILFESNSLMGDITSISETIYMNGTDKEFVSDTAVKYNGQDLSARLFINKEGVVLGSEAILGNSDFVALNLSTLVEKFTDSVIAEMLGMPAEQAPEVKQYLQVIKDMYENCFTMFDDIEAKGFDMANRMYAALEQTVTQETVNIDGKDYKCVVVTYTINNNTIEKCLDIYMDYYEDTMKNILGEFENIPELDMSVDEMMSGIKEELSYTIIEMNDTVNIDLTLKINIDSRSAKIKSETVSGIVSEKDFDNESASINGEIIFGEDKISADAFVAVDEDTFEFDFALTKTSDKDTVTYKAVADYKLVEEGEPAEEGRIVDLSCTYNKTNGAFEISGNVGPDYESVYVGLEGSLSADSDSATIEITSVTVDDVSVRFKLVITFNKAADVPQRPADAKDIIEMTEGEWVDLILGIQESPIGQLIASFSDSSYDDEYYYEENYGDEYYFADDYYYAFAD